MNNKDQELVSVIIPCYNRENTIEASVNSVLKQTYQNIEIIVVDDCSTDSTLDKVEKISDSRIRIIKLSKNCGPSVARNIGVIASKGKYIAFHDSDDICYNERICVQLNALISNRVDFVFCAFKRNYSRNRIFPKTNEGIKSLHDILMGAYVSTQTMFGKREVFEENKFDPNISMCEDYDLAIRIAEKYKVYFVNKVLVDVRISKNSLTNQQNLIKTENNIKYFMSKYSSLETRYPDWTSKQLSMLAKAEMQLGKEYRNLYKQSFTLYRSFKGLVRLILVYTGIFRLIQSNRK